MHLRCPHCQNPIEMADLPSAGEITCAGCGSSFQVANFSTATWQGPKNKRIGKFEVICTVGHGAFGTVLKAHDTELDRIVAIKVPRASNVGPDPQDIDRFLREARSVAQLHFPSIITIHEVGIESGVPYLVCDFVEGVTLADRLTAHAFSFTESARLLAEVADALRYAHTLGVVHRDVKPSNIMIRPDGTPCVMDFGLAKREAGEITMTIDGQILGTPAYMSPEQARGEGHRVDGRSDVYSLGVILYQLLTGELPFRGNKTMLLHQVLHEEPRSPRTLNDKIPRDLETIALKAMAKEPARRYASAKELADDLRHWLAGEPIQARPVGRLERTWRWCRRNPSLATASGLAVAALLAVAVVSTWAALAQHHAAEQIGKEKEKTDDALKKVSAEKVKTEQALHESTRLAATLALDRGLALCENGDVAHGMLWLARSLEIAPADAGDLQRATRANLGAWRHMLQPLENVLSHPNALQAAIFSPDGRTIATGCLDHKARLWNAASGEPLGVPMDHKGGVNIVLFSKDSQTLITASADKTVRFWNANTGAPIDKIAVRVWVQSMALSPDEKYLAVGDLEGEIRFFDFKTRELAGATLRHPERIKQVGFSPDGKTVVTATWPGAALRFWDVPSGKPIRELAHKTGGVKAFALSRDGKRLATAGSDGLVMLWDAQTGQSMAPAFAHLNEVSAVAFSPDGKTLLTASMDQAARLWDVATGKPLGHPMIHQGEVWRFAFSHDGKTVATCGFDGTARCWDASDGRPLAASMQHQAPVTTVAFSPDDATILTAGQDGRAQLWGKAGRSHLLHLLPADGRISAAAFDRVGKILLTGDWGGSGKLWDVATGKQIGPSLRNLRHLNRLYAVALSPDGKTAVTSSQRWDVARAELIGTPLVDEGPVNAVAFSPDGKHILTGVTLNGVAGKGQLWDTKTGAPVGLDRLHSAPIYAVLFSPDGSKFVTAGGNPVQGEAHLCATASGKLIGQPIRHEGLVEQAAFSPDGRLLATASFDHTARLWDTVTAQPVGRVMVHQAAVACVAFSPDGATIVTGSSDRLARFWDVRGNPVGVPLPHTDILMGAAFSPDGQSLVTGCDNGEARLWDVATAKPIGPRVRHRDSIQVVAFCPDGKAWLTASIDATAKLWKIPEPWSEDVERINLRLQWTTGLELDRDSGAVVALDAAAWRERGQRLQKQGDLPQPIRNKT